MVETTLKFLLRRAKTRGIPDGKKPRNVKAIADKAGISRQYLYRLLDGEPISDETAPAVAKALGVKVATLRRASRASARKPKRRRVAKLRRKIVKAKQRRKAGCR